MRGPFPAGTYAYGVPSSSWDYWEKKHLVQGAKYRVVRPFVDADGDTHAVGEEWTLVSSMFSRYDEVFTICVRLRGDDEWTVPLRWRADLRDVVVDNFESYITRV
jgi:hypothetical protein